MGISNYGIAFETTECQIKSGNNNEYTIAHPWHNCYFTSTKFLWGRKGKDQGSSFYEGTSHTYTHWLSYSRISILS